MFKAVLPAAELEFQGQAVHVLAAEAPVTVEYVPAHIRAVETVTGYRSSHSRRILADSVGAVCSSSRNIVRACCAQGA
jgi:hypothetical protein